MRYVSNTRHVNCMKKSFLNGKLVQNYCQIHLCHKIDVCLIFDVHLTDAQIGHLLTAWQRVYISIHSIHLC